MVMSMRSRRSSEAPVGVATGRNRGLPDVRKQPGRVWFARQGVAEPALGARELVLVRGRRELRRARDDCKLFLREPPVRSGAGEGGLLRYARRDGLSAWGSALHPQ